MNDDRETRSSYAVTFVAVGRLLDDLCCGSALPLVFTTCGFLLIFATIFLVFIIQESLLDAFNEYYPYEFDRFGLNVAALALGVQITSRYVVLLFTNPGNDLSKTYYDVCTTLYDLNDKKRWKNETRARLPPKRRRTRYDPDDDDGADGAEKKNGRRKIAKPPRSCFSKTTRRVVLNFDHNCPWLNNGARRVRSTAKKKKNPLTRLVQETSGTLTMVIF